jgi:hypothetical protein
MKKILKSRGNFSFLPRKGISLLEFFAPEQESRFRRIG